MTSNHDIFCFLAAFLVVGTICGVCITGDLCPVPGVIFVLIVLGKIASNLDN